MSSSEPTGMFPDDFGILSGGVIADPSGHSSTSGPVAGADAATTQQGFASCVPRALVSASCDPDALVGMLI